MWNRSFLLATLASCSLAAENSIQGFNGTTSTLVPSTNPGSGIETPVTVTPVPETSNPATPPISDTSVPQTATPGTPTPETPIIVTILPVTPITPVPIGVNTSTITPTGFTLSYTVDKSVVTDLTELPTLTTSRTTSAEKSIAKTNGKSVISTAETLGDIDATSSAAKSVETATTLGPIYTDVPTETTAHGRVPGDTSLTAPAESQAKTVDEGTALPVITPTTGVPEETAVKTVDEETALPVVTPTTVPEEDDPPEISPSPTGGNVVVLPDPDQPHSTTALATVVKTVEDGTALDPPTATAPGRTVVKSTGGVTTLLMTQVPPGNADPTGDTAPSTEAKVVASQTGLGGPAPTNDVADAANTENAGGNVASYIACGLDNSCFKTTGAAEGSQVVVVLPAPTQESNSGAGESQPGSPNEGNDISGQRVPANALTEDFTYTAGAPTVVYDSNTLSVGGAAMTISGAQVTLASGGLVVDGNTYTAPVAAPEPTSQAVALLPAEAAYTYDAAESTFVYGSATLSVGGPAITVDGHTVSLAPSGGGVVFDSSTIVPSGESLAVVLSSDGSSAYAYTPGASTLVYGSTTLSVGGPAATIAGKSITLGSDGVLVDGATITPEPVAAGPASATFDYTPGASTLVYGSTTLSVGGPAVTVDGKSISLASDAVLVDGATITPQPVVVVAASATFDYTPGASTFVYGSTTLSILAGGQVVVDGSVVAAATRSPSPAAVVTLGDEVRSLTKGATLSVDGSAVLTLTPGAVVTSLPGDGESISVGQDGVVIDGKTVTFVSSTTRSAAASTTRSGLTTSRTTATGASASDGTGSAALASSTAAAGRSAQVYSAGALIAVFGWIGAFVGI